MTSIDQNSISIIAALTNLTPAQCERALSPLVNPAPDEIIPCTEIQRITGWSRSTLRRRLKELGIQTCLVPGWRAKKGINKAIFEKRSGLSLDNINQRPNKEA